MRMKNKSHTANVRLVARLFQNCFELSMRRGDEQITGWIHYRLPMQKKGRRAGSHHFFEISIFGRLTDLGIGR
jgi:hypothetical protein